MKKEIRETTGKYVTEKTFEKHMANVAKSFARVDERFGKIDERFDRIDKVMNTVLKQLQEQNQEARENRMMMNSLNFSDVSQQRKIEGLEIRVEKLESKLK
jgi:hypothetical protein